MGINMLGKADIYRFIFLTSQSKPFRVPSVPYSVNFHSIGHVVFKQAAPSVGGSEPRVLTEF